MARHTVPITEGKGSINLVEGMYNAEAAVPGYDASTLDPNSVTIVSGTDTYAFTISANGTVTFHVTETGSSSGVQVIGAKFVRTDSTGKSYGDPIITGIDGNATFQNVPWLAESGIKFYYKQIASDGGHTFDNTQKEITLTEQTSTVEIANPIAPERNFTLVDANYANIPIETGQIILTDS